MRVGIIQSSFIPWRGFFDIIASVDLFVFHDDLQYTKRYWRNRNKIKTPRGTEWLTVPVAHSKTSQLICGTAIDETTDLRRSHLRKWQANYGWLDYFDDIMNLLGCMKPGKDETISRLSIRLIRSLCRYLDIGTLTILSSEMYIEYAKTERLVNFLRTLGGITYLAGPSADNYLDRSLFESAGVRPEYKFYDYEPHSQLWGQFEGAVSALDLIANCGPASRTLMRSTTPNRIVIP